MKDISVQLAAWNPISTWRPQIGDVVIYHGLFTHWFGIVNSISSGKITVVKAGLPILLLTMDEFDMPKNQIELSVSRVRSSRGGKYAVLQLNAGSQIWYV